MILRKGDKVFFYQGRRPRKGIVDEVLEDDRIVINIQTSKGTSQVILDEDQVKPFEEVSGKNSVIRFR